MSCRIEIITTSELAAKYVIVREAERDQRDFDVKYEELTDYQREALEKFDEEEYRSLVKELSRKLVLACNTLDVNPTEVFTEVPSESLYNGKAELVVSTEVDEDFDKLAKRAISKFKDTEINEGIEEIFVKLNKDVDLHIYEV